MKNIPNTTNDILTRLKLKNDNAYSKSRSAANASSKANRRVKMSYFSAVNSTLNNHSISPKNFFAILIKLMKNGKFSKISLLI